MERFARFVFRHRNVLAALPLAFALVSTRWEWERDGLAWGIAAPLFGLGVAIRTWATLHCRYGGGGRKELATTGPYALVRNPLYLGNLAILAAAVVASEVVWILPLAFAWAFLVYNVCIRYEDARLCRNYGEAFLRYRERVPMWIPRIPFRTAPLLGAAVRQLPALLVLLPFVLKELRLFGFGSTP